MTALRLLTFTNLSVPLQAIAQQTQEPTTPPYYGFGPWHHMMWGYAGWWMFGMMLFFFLIVI